ncbi:MAG: PEP-CTERM sorting domain-containing protein [Gammaproteobacteria bacterium]
MKYRTLVNTGVAVAAATFMHTSSADIIAFDLVDSASQSLISYTNPYTDAFSSPGDGFQVYQQGTSATIPFALVDESAGGFPNDSLGIVNSTNTDTFFGIVDTQNADNSEPVAAQWVFDIAGASNLGLSMDMAAMGDFESSDVFSWQYAIDGGPLMTLFEGITDDTIAQDYTLEGGSMFTLNDPMTVNGMSLSNEFLNFSNMLDGTGSTLTLLLNATTNGGSEGIAFQNIIVTGDSITTVSEPSILVLFSMGLGLLGFARRK